MPRLIVTGASGYIGRRLCEYAVERGFEVVALGSAPAAVTILRAFQWRLGNPPPADAFDNTAAIIHLAHSWPADAHQGPSPNNVNLTGAEMLARAALSAGVPRFVLASTISARAQAPNAYGRIKHALEERLQALPGASGRVVCARIGLVYGGPEVAQYGLLSNLVRLGPVLPMIGLDRMVQPIHLDEVVAGLFMLGAEALPQRDGLAVTNWVLAGPQPITFADWLRMLRHAQTGKRIWLLPVPLGAALAACDLTRVLPLVPRVDRERVLGLNGTVPMPSADDLAALGIPIVPPIKRLASLPSHRRRMMAEARAMLAYVSGRGCPPKAAIARLVRGINRHDDRALGLPRFSLACPAAIRLFEPLRPQFNHRLATRLHLASMVMECAPEPARRRPPVASLLAQAVIEILAIPFRLILGRRFA